MQSYVYYTCNLFYTLAVLQRKIMSHSVWLNHCTFYIYKLKFTRLKNTRDCLRSALYEENLKHATYKYFYWDHEAKYFPKHNDVLKCVSLSYSRNSSWLIIPLDARDMLQYVDVTLLPLPASQIWSKSVQVMACCCRTCWTNIDIHTSSSNGFLWQWHVISHAVVKLLFSNMVNWDTIMHGGHIVHILDFFMCVAYSLFATSRARRPVCRVFQRFIFHM